MAMSVPSQISPVDFMLILKVHVCLQSKNLRADINRLFMVLLPSLAVILSHFTCHRTPAVVTAPPPGSVRLFNQNYPAAPTPFGNGMPLAMLAAQRPIDGNNLGARKNLEYVGNRHPWHLA